jgi:hypothetical protein
MAATTLIALLQVLGSGGTGSTPDFTAEAAEDSLVVSGATRQEGSRSTSTRGPYRVYMFLPACQGNDPNSPTSLDTDCAGSAQMCATTPDPTDLMFWRFVATRTRTATGTTTGAWTPAGQFCLRRDQAPGTAVPAFTAGDLQRLPLPAPRIQVEPVGRPILCCNPTVPTNLYTADSPATFHTRVLGIPVTVTARPVAWTWAYGDGSTIRHTIPGGAYPDLSTAHTYPRPGTYVITLITTWTGTYTLPGGPPLTIDGTATTTSTPVTITAIETRAELVADPLP